MLILKACLSLPTLDTVNFSSITFRPFLFIELNTPLSLSLLSAFNPLFLQIPFKTAGPRCVKERSHSREADAQKPQRIRETLGSLWTDEPHLYSWFYSCLLLRAVSLLLHLILGGSPADYRKSISPICSFCSLHRRQVSEGLAQKNRSRGGGSTMCRD